MKKIDKIFLFPLAIIFFINFSCKKKDPNAKAPDSPTRGEITIVADESLLPIVDAELNAFHAIYKDAKVNVVYESEQKAIDSFLKGDARLAILSRRLSDFENQVLKKRQLLTKTLTVGIDALAFVVHKDNPDSSLSYEKIQALFRGEIKNWKQINPNSPLKDIKIIFDNDSAASVRYIMDSVAKVEKLPSNCFAANSNPKVIEYVSQNKEAIGLIGVSWVSDRDDTVSRGFLDKVKVLALSRPGALDAFDYYQPYQAYIAQKEYPLRREIVIVNKEGRVGLGSGFTAFVAGDKGQRIILKSGLLPATMPLRIMQFK